MIKKTIRLIFGDKSLIYKFYLTYRSIRKLNFFFSLKNIYKIYLSSKLEFNLSNNKKKIEYYNNTEFKYDDWFSFNIPKWEFCLKDLEKVRYLEVGCFEGRSTIFVGKFFKEINSIDVVDTFKGSDEHANMEIDFDIVFKNFKNNTNFLQDKMTIHIKDSDSFFKNNNKKFNLCYIDGSHLYENVKRDLFNAYECLDENGIIICDDFLWDYYKIINYNPGAAIIEFIREKKPRIIYLGYQAILQKKY